MGIMRLTDLLRNLMRASITAEDRESVLQRRQLARGRCDAWKTNKHLFILYFIYKYSIYNKQLLWTKLTWSWLTTNCTDSKREGSDPLLNRIGLRRNVRCHFFTAFDNLSWSSCDGGSRADFIINSIIRLRARGISAHGKTLIKQLIKFSTLDMII